MSSRTTFFLTSIFFLATFSCLSQKTPITKEELPKVAQNFISDNFSDYNLDYIIKKEKFTTIEYEVRFREQLEIEFDAQGNWTEVDGRKTAISTTFIPKKIRDYVAKKFPNTPISKIEKEKFGRIEVELLNSIELVFNSDGDFLRIDD